MSFMYVWWNVIVCADLGEHLKGEARIQFLLSKMKEVRKVFQGIKSEIATIDRKRKRARRREKERESEMLYFDVAI